MVWATHSNRYFCDASVLVFQQKGFLAYVLAYVSESLIATRHEAEQSVSRCSNEATPVWCACSKCMRHLRTDRYLLSSVFFGFGCIRVCACTQWVVWPNWDFTTPPGRVFYFGGSWLHLSVCIWMRVSLQENGSTWVQITTNSSR